MAKSDQQKIASTDLVNLLMLAEMELNKNEAMLRMLDIRLEFKSCDKLVDALKSLMLKSS